MDEDRAARIEESLERIEELMDSAVVAIEALLAVSAQSDRTLAVMLYATTPRWRRWVMSWHHAADVIRQTEAEGRAAQDAET